MELIFFALLIIYLIFFGIFYTQILLLKKQLVKTHRIFQEKDQIEWETLRSRSFCMKDFGYLLSPLPKALEKGGNNIYQFREVYQKRVKLRNKRKVLNYSLILFAAILYAIYHIEFHP